MAGKQREVDLHYNTGRYATHDVPPCMNCVHLTKVGTPDYKGWKCKAYPVAINPRILDGSIPHTEEIPADDGYRYESKVFEDEDGKYKFRWDGGIEEVTE